jgi:hypothetical protein
VHWVTKIQARRRSALTCPYCRDSLDWTAIVCDGCRTGYHSECAGELGDRCGTLGCTGELISEEVKGDFLARWDRKAGQQAGRQAEGGGSQSTKPGVLRMMWLVWGGFPSIIVAGLVLVAFLGVLRRHRDVERDPILSLALIAVLVLVGLGVGVVRSRTALKNAEDL